MDYSGAAGWASERRSLLSEPLKPAIDITLGGMAKELLPDELSGKERRTALLPPEPLNKPKGGGRVGPVSITGPRSERGTSSIVLKRAAYTLADVAPTDGPWLSAEFYVLWRRFCASGKRRR
jgi:hypothetical protein